jgi:glycosyltransferase involved in cell wall biosynthesis
VNGIEGFAGAVAPSPVEPLEPVRHDGAAGRAPRPLLSVVVPAYNEAAIVEKNLARLCEYMQTLEDECRWEIVFVNDGSTDGTGELAEAFALTRDNIRVLHHPTNFGLGQAFKFAFSHCRGDYIATLDLDLSYSPEHIRELLVRIRTTRAKIVLTSPYMKGGRISSVPWMRRTFSIAANRFLSLAARGNLSTLTSMVRIYDGKFLRGLNLKAMGMEVNPEAIYKAMLLRARIEEIPAHLDWSLQNAEGARRRSSMRLLRHTVATLFSGFLFRPFMFFVIPGAVLLLMALYLGAWMVVHVVRHYQALTQYDFPPARASWAVAAAYDERTHAFVIGGMLLMLAIQLISLGILALQSKNYFEEIFHLGTTMYRSLQQDERGRR